MKTIRIIVVIGALLATSATHANLIDLTPGGFSTLNPPPVVVQWEQTIFLQHIFVIAHADIVGNNVSWHPLFPLGGSNFSVDPQGANASVTWSLTNISGSSLFYIVTGGGTGTNNLYQVSSEDIINGFGITTLDGSTTLSGINFFGITPMPDETNTGALLFFAVVALLLTYEAQRA